MSQVAPAQPDGVAHGRVRWPLIILVVLGGIASVVAAWLFWKPSNPGEFWSALLLNVGTTLGLVALIFWLERAFINESRTVAREVAREAATEVAKEIGAGLSARIDSLQEQVDSRVAARKYAEDEALESLGVEASWAGLADALDRAKDLGAIEEPVVVQAGKGVDAPLVGVSRRYASVNEYGQTWSDAIILSFDGPELHGAVDIMSEWHESATPVDAFATFTTMLTSRGFGPAANRLNFGELVTNLREALADSLAGRRDDEGAWRSTSPLREQIGPDWAVTADGIEHRGHGVVVLFRDLPRPYTGQPVEVPVPTWADRAWWDLVFARAEAHYVRYHGWW